MLIGCLELPNKWALGAKMNGCPFVYDNEQSYFQNSCELWGGVIKIDPWFKNYKIISQIGTHVAEYWCVMLDKPDTAGLLVPIAMKRYGYNNKNAKCFVFKHGLANLLTVTNIDLYNYNRAYIYKQSAGEFLLSVILDNSDQFPLLAKQWKEITWHNRDKVVFPSGKSISINDLLQRCSMIDTYARQFVCQLNEMTLASDIGINSAHDLLESVLDFLPISLDIPGYTADRPIPPTNILEYSKTPTIEIDWIGECILEKDLSQFDITAVSNTIVRTPESLSTISILHNVSKQEELIQLNNEVGYPIQDSPGISPVDRSSLMEAIDDIITSICIDEATTFEFTYDRDSGQMKYLSRFYGYGVASRDYYSGPSKEFNPIDICEFSLQAICEVLDVVRIKCIKTYNEELFLECTYMNGQVSTFYVNILVHLCVTGTLFCV